MTLLDWLRSNPLSASDVDCVAAVMLKILDGKCKMGALEKHVMAQLYQLVRGYQGLRLAIEVHDLIDLALEEDSEAMRDRVYEYRVLAETRISRPVMKAFKAKIRAQGLYEGAWAQTAVEMC